MARQNERRDRSACQPRELPRETDRPIDRGRGEGEGRLFEATASRERRAWGRTARLDGFLPGAAVVVLPRREEGGGLRRGQRTVAVARFRWRRGERGEREPLRAVPLGGGRDRELLARRTRRFGSSAFWAGQRKRSTVARPTLERMRSERTDVDC